MAAVLIIGIAIACGLRTAHHWHWIQKEKKKHGTDEWETLHALRAMETTWRILPLMWFAWWSRALV